MVKLIQNILPKLKPQFTQNISDQTTAENLFNCSDFLSKNIYIKQAVNQNKSSIG
jgi:hypothetical protein